MKALFTILAATATLVAFESQAQIRIGKNGQLTGSLESNSIYYVEDKKIGATPDDDFGTHDYLKLDYTNGRFAVGVQGELYAPALQGYDIGLYGDKKFMLSKYISWQDKNYGFLVGDIFDQFGNGLVFRTFEDRQLGFNNSLEGAHARFGYDNYFTLKAMYGRPRLYTEYADSWVGGADLSLSLSEILRMKRVGLSIEGSFVNRHQSLENQEYFDLEMQEQLGVQSSVNMYSGRLNFDWKGLTLSGEYVAKSKDLFDATQQAGKGNATLLSVGYNHKTFSFSGSFRRLEHMNTMLSIYAQGTGNVLNYLPALTRQYTYMLANLTPYQVQANGETGGQADFYYTLRKKGVRHKYWNFHANFSTYYSLDKIDKGSRKMFWRDINADAERQWNKSWKTTFLYSRQEYLLHIDDNNTSAANIFVADVLYKINRKHSLRFELQYLYAEKYDGLFADDFEGDWVAGLVEYNIAPKWSFFVSDMYNNGKTKNHYYSGGVSFTKSRTRIQLSYGRNRAGYVCSGGVCRYSPAYTGANLVLTSSF